jgi:hypothetical protein
VDVELKEARLVGPQICNFKNFGFIGPKFENFEFGRSVIVGGGCRRANGNFLWVFWLESIVGTVVCGYTTYLEEIHRKKYKAMD